MFTLINGSQKTNKSNSMYFLNYASKKLINTSIFDLKSNDYKDIIFSINKNKTIILAFPLYVDSPTSIVLGFLDYLYDNKINLANKNLYVIINCGFKEGEQNINAVNIIKNFCFKKNINYMGSIMIGAGEIVGKSKYKFICRKAYKRLNQFINCIKQNKKSGDIVTTMDIINSKMYCILANKSWNKKAKSNKLNYNDICKK
ncbi:MAG: hypothetical protein Q4E75_04760 [bacterium]|nr:hypothetical protein [bacterium]